VSLEILTALTTNCDVKACSMAEECATYIIRVDNAVSRFYRNVGLHLSYYMASHPERQLSANGMLPYQTPHSE